MKLFLANLRQLFRELRPLPLTRSQVLSEVLTQVCRENKARKERE